MKKALLGTTALVAAGLAVGDAYAADGVKLSIGGRYMGAAGVIFGEKSDDPGLEDNTRNYVFKQDVEVYFLGETTLDNGLTVGARVELEGQTSGDQIDAVYAYFSGGFGEIRFGDTSEALGQMCYLVPSASAIFGADSPNFNFSNAGLNSFGPTNGTCYGVDDKSTKLVYFSPNFGGFSFAASFTPDASEDTRNTFHGAGTRLKHDGTNDGPNSENISAALNYTHDFNGVHLVVGGAGTWSLQRETNGVSAAFHNNTDKRQEYNGYAQVGFSGFTIGGAVSSRVNRGNAGEDDLVYGAGITYNWDAWTVGFGWTHGDYELIGNGAVTGTKKAAGGTITAVTRATADTGEKQDIFAITASYALGPGIQVDGVLEYDDAQIDEGNLDAWKGFSIGLGTLINF